MPFRTAFSHEWLTHDFVCIFVCCLMHDRLFGPVLIGCLPLCPVDPRSFITATIETYCTQQAMKKPEWLSIIRFEYCEHHRYNWRGNVRLPYRLIGKLPLLLVLETKRNKTKTEILTWDFLNRVMIPLENSVRNEVLSPHHSQLKDQDKLVLLLLVMCRYLANFLRLHDDNCSFKSVKCNCCSAEHILRVSLHTFNLCDLQN